MGKCENMSRLKASHEERAHKSVMEAAERGHREHLAFETQGSDSRCFVASWALGSEHWATGELRAFRDSRLLGGVAGRLATEAYYMISPGLIKVARRVPGARFLSAKALCLIAARLRRSRLGRGL